MKIKIVENKYLNALLILMLISAIAHMIILIFSAIIFRNFHILNYFNILNLNYFFPIFFNTFLGDIVAAIFLVLLYFTTLKIND